MAHQGTQRLRGNESRRLWVATTDVHHARVWLTLSGIFAIVGGIVAIAVPAIASVTISLFIGWILVFAGAVATMHAFSEPSDRRLSARRVQAVLTLLIGLYLVLLPLSGTLTLTVLLAAWFFASGVLLLAAASEIRGLPGAGMMALNGALSLVLGLLIAVDLPSSANWAIGLLVGINLIFWGVRALIVAAVLRRAQQEDWT
jgi:uncharacterized membrane protein HdeD (DUF308 family)